MRYKVHFKESKAGFKIVKKGEHITMTNGDRLIVIPRSESCQYLRNGWNC